MQVDCLRVRPWAGSVIHAVFGARKLLPRGVQLGTLRLKLLLIELRARQCRRFIENVQAVASEKSASSSGGADFARHAFERNRYAFIRGGRRRAVGSSGCFTLH